jgi:hypothetical protein
MDCFSVWEKLRAWPQRRRHGRIANGAARREAGGRRAGFESLEQRLAMALTVSLSNDFVFENVGAVAATVTRSGDLSQALTVSLSSSDASEAAVPASVVIGVNQSSASFDVSVANDGLLDEDRIVSIAAAAAGHAGGEDFMLVRNDDQLALPSAPLGAAIRLAPTATAGQYEATQGAATVLGGAAGSEPVVDLSVVTSGDQRRALPLDAVSLDYLATAALVKVNVSERYTLSAWAANVSDFNEAPLGFASLDVDKQLILPEHVAKYAYAADTRLTRALSPGDTAIYVADASGWSNDAWESSLTRMLAWYGYADSTGHIYADYTYTQNVAGDLDGGLWAPAAIHYDLAKGAYRIDLRTAWAGPALPAGAAVRNAASGDKYNLPVAATVANDSNHPYTAYAATVGGGQWSGGVRDESEFRPGTAYIQPVFAIYGLPIEIVVGPEEDSIYGGPSDPTRRTAEVDGLGRATLLLDVLGIGALGGATTVAIDSVETPAFGTASFSGAPGPAGRPLIRYHAPAGFVGTDVVNYTLRDAATNQTYAGSVTVHVLGAAPQQVGSLPVTVRDIDYTMLAGETLNADGVRELGALGNALGPPGGSTVRLVAGPGHGTLKFNSDGTFAYTPAAEFVGTDVIRTESLTTAGTTAVTVVIRVMSSAESVAQARLKEIGTAVQNYRSAKGRYPIVGTTASQFDGSGNPLLSWRVHILPYLGYQALYGQFHLDEPWDSANNLPLASQMPDVFRSVSDSPTANTTRLATIGNEGAPYYWRRSGGLLVGPRSQDFTDGQSNSFFAVEAGADKAVVWTRPADLALSAANPLASLGTLGADGFRAVMADGSVVTLSSAMDAADFAALATISGGEAVDAATLARAYSETHGGTTSAAAEAAVDNNFRQIALGLLNHESSASSLPVTGARSLFDAEGNPLLSWRVHLLPFMGYSTLYNKFHLDEPWDSANNLPLLAEMPDVFRSAGDPSTSTTTRVQTFYGDGAAFRPMPGTSSSVRGVRLASVADGLDSTLAFVETGADKAVPWTKPSDAAFDPANPLAALGTLAGGTIRAAFLDGRVSKLPSDIAADALKALVTIAGREIVDWRALVTDDAKLRTLDPRPSVELNQLKQIVLAMLDYESTRKVMPASSFAADGTPLLSWRVHILPYLEQQALYDEFHKNEPWDSPHNLALLDKMPSIFRMSGDAWDVGTTRALVATGAGAPFPATGTNATKGPAIGQFSDGTSNTLAVVAAGGGTDVPWTKPSDLPFNANNPFSALGELGPNFLAAFADGSVRIQLASMTASQLAAYLTHRGGEDVANPPAIATTPAVFVSQSAGDARLNEFGVDWFDVVLDTAPTTAVTVTIGISDPTAATLDRTTLTFTPANWNVRQRVALRATDNFDYNPDQTVDVTVSAAGYATGKTFAATIRNDDLGPLPGDFNGDQRVDGRDFLAWQRGAGTTWRGARTQGDADLDADVDRADLSAWSAQLGAVGNEPFAADFDRSGHVDQVDLAAWAIGYGIAEHAAAEHGDANFDGDVDGRDFLAWQRSRGGVTSAAESSIASLETATLAAALAQDAAAERRPAAPAMLAGLPSLRAEIARSAAPATVAPLPEGNSDRHALLDRSFTALGREAARTVAGLEGGAASTWRRGKKSPVHATLAARRHAAWPGDVAGNPSRSVAGDGPGDGPIVGS